MLINCDHAKLLMFIVQDISSFQTYLQTSLCHASVFLSICAIYGADWARVFLHHSLFCQSTAQTPITQQTSQLLFAKPAVWLAYSFTKMWVRYSRPWSQNSSYLTRFSSWSWFKRSDTLSSAETHFLNVPWQRFVLLQRVFCVNISWVLSNQDTSVSFLETGIHMGFILFMSNSFTA